MFDSIKDKVLGSKSSKGKKRSSGNRKSSDFERNSNKRNINDGNKFSPTQRKSPEGSKRSSLSSNSTSQNINKPNRSQRRSRPANNRTRPPAGSQGGTRNPQRKNNSPPAGLNQNKRRRDNDSVSNFDRRNNKGDKPRASRQSYQIPQNDNVNNNVSKQRPQDQGMPKFNQDQSESAMQQDFGGKGNNQQLLNKMNDIESQLDFMVEVLKRINRNLRER